MDWHTLTPAAGRAACDEVDGAPPLLSGALLSRHARVLDAPVLELTASRAATIVGFLRACRQADAVAVIAVPADARARTPQASALALRGVLAAGAIARHDRPIVVFARALPASGEPALALARDVAAGSGAVAMRADDVKDPDVLLRASQWARDPEIGVELEVAPGDDAALLLASLDDRAVPLSAVRGAGLHDEVGAAARVIDVSQAGQIDGLDPGGLRVTVDAALAGAGDDDAEGRAWLMTSRLIRALGAAGTAGRLAVTIESSS